MTPAERTYLAQWFEKADHDLIAAALMIDQQPLILDVACFHCQQAIEKYFKAFLIFKKQDFPKTHNLDMLLNLCSQQDADFSAIDVSNLEDFAVRGRYPHDFIIPDKEETDRFYQLALTVKKMIQRKIAL